MQIVPTHSDFGLSLWLRMARVYRSENVCFGSITSFPAYPRHFRFSTVSDTLADMLGLPIRANSCREQVQQKRSIRLLCRPAEGSTWAGSLQWIWRSLG